MKDKVFNLAQECPNLKNCDGACFQCEYYNAETGEMEYPVVQPAQEPVAWIYKGEKSFDGNKWSDEYELTASKQVALWKDKDAKPLYTAPPQRPWVGLTDDEIVEIHSAAEGQSVGVATGLTERKLKEKNT